MKKVLLSLFIILALCSGVYAEQIAGEQVKSGTFVTPAELANATASVSVNQTVSVTAGENLTAGDVVSLINSYGTVTAKKNNLAVNTSPNGAESVFNSAATIYIKATAIDTTRFIVTYIKADSCVYARVGTVTNSTIAWGTESAAIEAVYSSHSATCKLGTDKILLAYNDATNSKGRIVVLSISTSTISVGTPADLDTNAQNTRLAITQLDTDKALVCYTHANAAYSKIVTVSSTTPTPYPAAGTVGTSFNAAFADYISVSALSSSLALVAFQDAGDSYYGHSVTLSISGTTITPSDETTFLAAQINSLSVAAMDSTHALITYRNGATTNTKARACSFVGTAPTFGTELALSSLDSNYHSTTKISSTMALCTFTDLTNSLGKSVILNLSGTDITANSIYTFNAAVSNYKSVCYLGSQNSVICYSDTADTYGKAVINNYATISYDSVAGISQGSYSSGTTATVLIKGTDTHQTGLIFPTTYWLQSDMSIGTLPVSLGGSYIRLGISKSATELIMD